MLVVVSGYFGDRLAQMCQRYGASASRTILSITTFTYGQSLERRPADTVRKSITGMLPKNRRGRQVATKLKVYAGPEHPHSAQLPPVLDIPGARREVK